MSRPPYPAGIELVTSLQLDAMLEQGELSPSLWYRRDTLVAVAGLAALAKGSHDPLSRWRLKAFRAELGKVESNDEVEVAGETLCETAMLALAYLGAARC